MLALGSQSGFILPTYLPTWLNFELLEICIRLLRDIFKGLNSASMVPPTVVLREEMYSSSVPVCCPLNTKTKDVLKATVDSRGVSQLERCDQSAVRETWWERYRSN